MTLILFIDIIIVVTLIAASRRHLENALPMFCFFLVLLPFEARLVVPGLFDLTTDRIALLTLLILFLVRREHVNTKPIPLKDLMLLHIGWALCSTLYSISVITSTKQLIAQVLEYYLLYYIFLRAITEVQTVHRIVYAIVTAMGLCCIFGFFEAYASWSILRIFPSDLWVTYDSRHDPLYIEWGRGIRIRSTFPHPILFGDALAMSIPMTLYLLSVWRQGRQRLVLWLAIVLMFWGVYKTSSRGPWIAVGISCVLLFVFVQNHVRRYLTVIALLLLIALLARPGIWQTIANLYQETQDSASIVGASYQYRPALNRAVKGAVASQPGRTLLGYGLGTFRELGLDIDFQGEVHRWYTCDDNWALFLYETGYGGLLIISILLLTPLLMTIRSYRHLPRPEKYFSGVLFIVLAAFYFLLLSVAGYSWGQQGFIAWILIALSVVYPGIVMRDRRNRAIAKAPPQSHIPIAEPVFTAPASGHPPRGLGSHLAP